MEIVGRMQLSASKNRIVPQLRITLSVVAVITGIVAYYYAEYRAGNVDQRNRQELLQQVSRIAQTLDPGHVNKLSFTENDADRHEYHALCKEMRLFQPLMHVRGIWSLALRDGKLVFGPESYAASDPLASAPGTVYQCPRQEVFDLFSDKKGFVIGPISDEYGDFVSAAAPVINPDSGEVLMTVGADILAADWRRQLWRERGCAYLKIIPLGLIVMAGLWFYATRRKHAVTIFATLFTVALASVILLERSLARQQHQREIFMQLAGTQAERVLMHLFRLRDDVLKSIELFFQNSEDVTKGEFEAFASNFLSYHGVFGIAWLERITSGDVARWTERVRREDGAEMFIWQRGVDGEKIPSDDPADVLYPVRFSTQASGGGLITGFNEGSVPQHHAAIEEACLMGRATATQPLPLVTRDRDVKEGIRVYLPVFRHAGERTELMGVALATFSPQRLIQSIIGAMPRNARFCHITLHQIHDDTPTLTIAKCCPDFTETEHLGNSKKKLLLEHPVFAFNNVYVLRLSPGESFYPTHPNASIWVDLAVMGLIAALIGSLIFVLSRQQSVLEERVQQRTQALRESEGLHRQAEEREHRLNQMLMGLRMLNQLIVRAQDPLDLIETACKNLKETLGYTTAWIALLDHENKLLASSCSGIDACFEALKNEITHKRFPNCMREVINGEKVFTTRNPAEACRDSCLMSQSHKNQAGMTVRLEHGHHRFGILAITIPTILYQDEMALELFKELAEELGLALYKLSTTKELKESEERFRRLLDHAPSAIFVQTGGGFAYLNSKAIELFGAGDAAELLGTPTLEHFRPDFRALVLKRRELLALRQTLPPAEEVIVRTDGKELHVEVTSVGIMFNGQSSVLVFARDITERIQAEEKQRKLEEQLHQSQKLESLGQLAGGVAHDYNNMLQVILGHAEMLLQDAPPGSTAAQDLDGILKAARRSADLTRQLLAFARKQTVSPRALDINGAVEELIKMLKPLIGAQIELKWHPGDSLPNAMLDPSQLNQILTNLVVNARDAMNGSGLLTIETALKNVPAGYEFSEVDTDPGDYLVLSVSDTGCGMDKETLARVWEPFFTTKPEGKGTGLGLSTVYGITRQCKGFVRVYSEPGKGTTFCIYLPCCKMEGEALGAEHSPRRHHGHETVLVVDDEPALLAFTQRLLQKLGYTVLAAASPREALRMAASFNGRIDLLLSDVVLPEINGRELYEQLSALRPDIKVLFMSGYTANAVGDREMLEKGLHFVQKPFTSAELGYALSAVFDGDVR